MRSPVMSLPCLAPLASGVWLVAAAACTPSGPAQAPCPPAASGTAAAPVAIALPSAAWTTGAPPRSDKATVVVRPREIADLIVNPGMGFQTFQRYRGQALYPGLTGRTWSEAGPVKKEPDLAAGLVRFPETSLAYCRWHWSTLEPEKGKVRWEILDLALAEAKRHGQTLALRLMPYDPDHPLPEWYRTSGAKRANEDADKDGKIWQPDFADPLYERHWGELVKKAGERYDGHADLESVDISSVGYWGEGWSDHMPSEAVEKKLLDVYFEAFRKTPLLVNDQPRTIEYAVSRGAGWRVDCWGDMRSAHGANFSHMLDTYPQLVAKPGVRDAWQKAPVSLEVCGVVGDWLSAGWDVDYILDQALRWHVSSVNLKSTEVPDAWKGKFDDFARKMGYRLILRRFEHPKRVARGEKLRVSMWWLNAGVAPPYRPYKVVLRVGTGDRAALIEVPIEARGMVPGDHVFEGDLAAGSLPPGAHPLAVAIVDPVTRAPAVRLAIEGRQADGFYPLGALDIE